MRFFARFKRTWINLGPYSAVMLFFVLAYIVYMAIRLASHGLYLGVALVIVGFLIPRLALTQMVDHAARVQRALNICWYIVIAVILLQATGVVTYNVYSLIVLLFLGPFYISARFWLISDPRIYTVRGMDHALAGVQTYTPPDDLYDEFDDPYDDDDPALTPPARFS